MVALGKFAFGAEELADLQFVQVAVDFFEALNVLFLFFATLSEQSVNI